MDSDTSAIIQAALAKHQAGDLVAAEQMYRNVLSITPDDAGIFNLLGVALFQQKKLSEASEEIAKAIRLNPSDSSFHFNRGVVAKAQGNSRQAEENYRHALNLKPDYPEVTQNLCNLLEEQARYEEAKSLYLEAVQIHPQNIKFQIKFALLCKKLGDWESVVSTCRKVLVLQPNNFEAGYLYGHALQTTGQIELAVDQYRMILKSDSRQADAHFQLSRLLVLRGKMQAALSHAQAAAELAPQRGAIQLNYEGMRLTGQYESANECPVSSGQNLETEQAVRAILGDGYANEAALRGWLFFTRIDYLFFDSQITRCPIQRRAAQWRTYLESADVNQASIQHLARISQREDISAQYAALEELTLLATPSLTQDSFVGLTEGECQQSIRQFFSSGSLNVVIVGAGPAGLVLASALKLALNTDVNVLLVENRVSSPHHKVPYERCWVTNILRETLDGLVEETLSDIFAKIGTGGYIGCTVNVLESLLLLSCRRMGVKFLFADNVDFSFVKDSGVQFVFDASGNRFEPLNLPDSLEKITVGHAIKTDLIGTNDAQIDQYGIKVLSSADNRQITLGSYENLLFPLYKNRPVKLAMLKLIHIPARLYGVLADYVKRQNADNKYFVWPGTLQAAINQVIVTISLNKAEYEYLCKHHTFPMSLTEALQIETVATPLDERTKAILKLLGEYANECDQIGIDAPFLCEPYLVNRATPDSLLGKPLIRVGDSIYSGNVKLGNGLGFHLRHVRHIREVLQKYVR